MLENTLRLGRGLLAKEVQLLTRYRVNTASYLVLMYAIFLVIFLGGRTFGGQTFDNSLGAIIVGYFLASLSFTSFSRLARTFSREASWGTLEQLYMAKVGFRRVTVLVAFTQFFLSFLIGTIILGMMLVTTGKTVSLDVVSIVPVLVFALLSVIGLGFVLGGAAVLYKRIDNVFGLMQFGFYGLVAAPVESYPALKFLPLAQGSYVLRLVMEQGYRLWEVPVADLGILVLTGVGYMLLGYVALGKIVGVARERGVLGHY